MKSNSNDKMMTLNFLQLIVHMRTSDNKDLCTGMSQVTRREL